MRIEKNGQLKWPIIHSVHSINKISFLAEDENAGAQWGVAVIKIPVKAAGYNQCENPLLCIDPVRKLQFSSFADSEEQKSDNLNPHCEFYVVF